MIARAPGLFFEAVRRLSFLGAFLGARAEVPPTPSAAGFFPLVGCLIGLAAAVTLLGTGAIFPEPVPVALTIAAVMALTGAVHHTGLMRAADRLGGDGSAGRAGTIALVIVLGLNAAALMGMDAFSAARTLIAAHAASRFAMVVTMWAQPVAGMETPESDERGISGNTLALALLFGFLPAAIMLSPVTAILASIAGVAAAAVAGAICFRRGLGAARETPDVVQQAFETAFLLVAAAVISGPG